MRSYSRLIVALAVVALVGLALAGRQEHDRPFVQRAHAQDYDVVIVYLQDQAQISIAQAVQEEYRPRLDALSQEVQLADGTLAAQDQRPTLATREEESAYASQVAATRLTTAEAREAHAAAVGALETAQSEMRREILARSAAGREASQDAVAAAVEDLGGEVVYRYDVVNAMVVAIPPDERAALAAHHAVATVFEDRLTETHMDVSAQAIYADTWWPTYDGGAYDVAIIDSGIDDSHPALMSQNFAEQRCLNSADRYLDEMPGWDPSADDVNGHGTHIAGTVAITDTSYRGIAYGLDYLLNGKAGFDVDGHDGGGASMFWSDGMACTDWALTSEGDDADVINLSYGSTATTDDGGYERFWDAVVDQLDAVVTIAAGNSGPAQSIGSPSIAYNVISVANVDDDGSSDRGDDSIAYSSSRGPTPDGRSKPDLAAPGTWIRSTNNDWEGASSDYVSLSGTSMAAPHVAGAAALLMDRGVHDPMAIKALLINTAEDMGTNGWDSAYGWGYIDLQHLDFHISDYFAGAISARPDHRFYVGPANSGDLATLVWHRRAVYNDDSYPSTYYSLTDLDLYLYNEADSVLGDWSISGIDNVEQVEADGAYTAVVKVDCWSTSIGGASAEDYVLATEENFSPMSGPAIEVVTTTVTGDVEASAGTAITVSARVENTGDLRAHDVVLDVDYSDGLTRDSGSESISIGVLEAGAATQIYTWRFTKGDDEPQWINLDAISSSYGETLSDSWWLPEAPTVYLPMVQRNN